MNGLTGTNPQSLKRHQCKVSFLASDHIRSDYVLLIPVLKQFSLDFCGTKRNSTPTDCKKKYTEWYEVEAGLIWDSHARWSVWLMFFRPCCWHITHHQQRLRRCIWNAFMNVININEVDYLLYHHLFPQNAFGGDTKSRLITYCTKKKVQITPKVIRQDCKTCGGFLVWFSNLECSCLSVFKCVYNSWPPIILITALRRPWDNDWQGNIAHP